MNLGNILAFFNIGLVLGSGLLLGAWGTYQVVDGLSKLIAMAFLWLLRKLKGGAS